MCTHMHPRERTEGKAGGREKFSCIVTVTITFSFTFLIVVFHFLAIVILGSEMLTTDTKSFLYTKLVLFCR